MSKKLKKMAVAMAMMATLFSQCDVMAAESEKAVVQAEDKSSTAAEDKSKVGTRKDKLKKGDAKAINARIDELDEKFETQREVQKKILEMLERFESERVKCTGAEVFSYNPLVNPSEISDFQFCNGNISGNVESLNFNYKISGASIVKLVAVFDDGEKTILKFDRTPKRLPSLFIKNKGKIIMANYKIRDNCYIVDRVADEIELRVSDKEIIKIKNKK